MLNPQDRGLPNPNTALEWRFPMETLLLVHTGRPKKLDSDVNKNGKRVR